MRKILNFVRDYWLLILFILIIILFIANKILGVTTPTSPTPIPASTGVANFKTILPGSTTQDSVNEILGFPVKTEEKDGVTISEYSSTNQYRNHVVTFENGVAVLIKEMVISKEEKTADSVINQFGKAPYILYDQDPTAVFNLYVYPGNGIAYLGGETGTLLEVWYFKPTTIDSFISKFGEGFAKDKPKGTNKY